MKLSGIVFDVDGTLAETEEFHRRAFNLTFSRRKMNWYWSKRDYKKLLFVTGGHERMEHYQSLATPRKNHFSKEYLRDLHIEKTKCYENLITNSHIKARKGVTKLIRAAKKTNMRIGISTATSFKNIDTLCKSLWAESARTIFDKIASGDEVRNKKPSPDLYRLILRKLNLMGSECIAIEDSRNGLLAAKGAGLTTLIVPSLYTSHENFSEADFLSDSLERRDLPEKLVNAVFKKSHI